MYSTKDLTNIILEIRKTNAKDSDLLLKLLDIIEDLYKQDEWMIFPITYNENEDKLFCITHMQIRTYLIMLVLRRRIVCIIFYLYGQKKIHWK